MSQRQLTINDIMKDTLPALGGIGYTSEQYEMWWSNLVQKYTNLRGFEGPNSAQSYNRIVGGCVLSLSLDNAYVESHMCHPHRFTLCPVGRNV